MRKGSTWVRGRRFLTKVNHSQSSATFTAHKQDKIPALVAMFLVDVSLLDTKRMRSRMLKSFCQLHKKCSKTHVVTKSLYSMTWFVCSNKFVFEKRGNISNTNVLTKKPVVFGFSKKNCKRIHDVSLRFVGNFNSECLQNVALCHH